MKQFTVTLIAAHLSVGWFLVQGFVHTTTSFSAAFQAQKTLSVQTRNKGTRGSTLPPPWSQQYVYQQQQRRPSTRYVAVDRHFSHDIEDNSSSINSRNNSNRNHVQSLWLFVHNLQKERREKRLQSNTNVSQKHQHQHHHHHQQPDERILRHPAKSLVSFLRQNHVLLTSSEGTPNHQHHQDQHLLIEPFSRALVQAIRLASELGDYKLIMNIVEAALQYANQQPILIPRVFGEAIDGLSKTSANRAKIKQLWNLGTSEKAQQVLTEPLGTFELNVMIKALSSRGTIRAVLDLYQESCCGIHTASLDDSEEMSQAHGTVNATVIFSQETATKIVPDAYTLSSIFSALHDSITEEQALKPLLTQGAENTTTNSAKNQQHQQQAYSSQCWQWNEAMCLLNNYRENAMQNDWPTLNNHVFSNLLKLNDRASQLYSFSSHNGPKMAMSILNTMHEWNISPDVVTCTLVISNLGYQWKTAVNLLYAMKTAPPQSSSGSSDSDTTTATSAWKLPRPNVYTYSAAITICAHCHQYQVAMDLLQEMKREEGLWPNTWVYNAALLATTRSDSLAVLAGETKQKHPSQRQRRSRERLYMALQLLREMQEEGQEGCTPDTVTYNTVLATLDGLAGPSDNNKKTAIQGFEDRFAAFFDGLPTDDRHDESFEDLSVHCLLDEMKEGNIPRDSITYRNAILAVRFSDNVSGSVWRLLERALSDKECIVQSAGGSKSVSQIQTTRQLDGRAAEGISFVFDTALTVLASHGDVEGVLNIFRKWMDEAETQKSGAKLSRASTDKIRASQVHFVQALGRADNYGRSNKGTIPILLEAIKGDRVARLDISKRCGSSIDERIFHSSELDEALFSSAISSCLMTNDIDSARKLLIMMRAEGLQPSDVSLQEIARTYAKLALMSVAEESQQKDATSKQQQNKKQTVDDEKIDEPTELNSRAKRMAQNAFSIVTKTLAEPSSGLLSTVARTCASVGLWKESRYILKMLHKRIPSDVDGIGTFGAIGAAQTVLPGLHRALLRASSIQGNVTAALWYIEDIQQLTKRISTYSAMNSEEEQSLALGDRSYLGLESESGAVPMTLSPGGSAVEALGVMADDWKLLLIAASKCGHWRVCLGTLQFLRPYLEETHPSSLGITVEERSRRYRHLAPALTVAVKCLEVRSQYGWAVRAIDDWIEWCGRRPPKAAVLAAIRILSARGRGAEVNRLLARCTSPETADLAPYSNEEKSFHLALYVGAITALHQEGLYDDADEAFINAVNGNFLPFDVHKEEVDGEQRMVLDLHGMNVPVAHSAVRVALQQKVKIASWQPTSRKRSKAAMNTTESVSLWEDDMIVVTGRGRNSAFHMRPVLRPEVQRMLLEEFYPPLSTTSIPGNMGALRVPALDIGAWLDHQRQQKGSRLLAVASLLKNVSSIDRLKLSITRAQKLQKADQKKPESTGDGEGDRS